MAFFLYGGVLNRALDLNLYSKILYVGMENITSAKSYPVISLE